MERVFIKIRCRSVVGDSAYDTCVSSGLVLSYREYLIDFLEGRAACLNVLLIDLFEDGIRVSLLSLQGADVTAAEVGAVKIGIYGELVADIVCLSLAEITLDVIERYCGGFGFFVMRAVNEGVNIVYIRCDSTDDLIIINDIDNRLFLSRISQCPDQIGEAGCTLADDLEIAGHEYVAGVVKLISLFFDRCRCGVIRTGGIVVRDNRVAEIGTHEFGIVRVAILDLQNALVEHHASLNSVKFSFRSTVRNIKIRREADSIAHVDRIGRTVNVDCGKSGRSCRACRYYGYGTNREQHSNDKQQTN